MRNDAAREDLALNGGRAKQAEHEKRSTRIIRENDNTNAVAVTVDDAVRIFENNVVLNTVKVAQTNATLPPPAGNGPVKVLKPDAAGVVVLPAGSKISVIQASGGDLRIVLDDGSVFVVEGGVANPPSIQIGNETIPSTSLTTVFGPFQEVQPAAGDTPPGSSPNFTTTSTFIDQGFQFSELLGTGPTNLFGRGNNDEQSGNDFTPVNGAPYVGTQQSVSLDEDAVDGVTVNPSAANVFNGQLVYLFGSNGPNAIAPISFDAQALTDLGLTAGGAPVVFAWDASNFTLTGTANGVAVFSLRMVDPVAGTYVITLSGAFDHAGAGKDGIALSIPFLIRDGDGTENPGMLNVTVVDDVPAANVVAGTGDENAQIVIDLIEGVAGDFYAGADGLLSIATGTATVSNTHGLTLAIPALTFDPVLYRLTVVLGPTYDALSAGETATVTVPYTVTDGDGDTITNSIVLTITGTNDTPTITAAVGAIEEFEGQTLSLIANTVFGIIDFADLDVNDVGHAATVVSVAASGIADGLPPSEGSVVSPVLSWLQLGAVTKAAGSTDGSIAWTFSAQDRFFDYLAAGQALTLTYTIALDDGDGGIANQTVTITVVGTNDRPEFIAGGAASVTELTNSLESPTLHLRNGTLTFSDVDRDNIGHTAQVSFAGATGVTNGLDQTAIENALSITAPVKVLDAQSGTIAWSFSAADREFDYLARGEQLVLTYNVTVDDGAGGANTTTVTVTITGTNDAPVLTAGTGEIEERAGTTLSLQANSTFGTLVFDDYDLNDVGHTARVIGVTRSGESDGLPSGLIGNALVRSWLQIDDVTKAAGSTGGTIDWTFSAADAFFDYLAEGEEVQLTYTVELNDRDGGITTTTVTITVTGTNDRPVFVGGGLAFDSEIFNRTDIGQRHDLSGTLNFVDVDRDNIGHTADVEYIGAIGTTSGLREQRIENALTLDTPVKLENSQIGSIDWSFSARDRVFDYLAAGEFVTLAYRVSVDDGAGGTDSTVVLVTILGTNDRPIIQPGQDQARLREIAGQTGQYDLLTAQKTLTFTDADLSDTHSVRARLSDLDWSDGARRDIPAETRDALRNDAFEVTLIDGPGGGEIVWSFSIEDRLVDFLGKDETLTIEYTVRVRDDSGESNRGDSQTVTITITGRNDRPVIESNSDLRGRVFEPGDVFGVQEAGYGAGLEITIPICGCIQMQLDSITSNPANIQNVLSAVNALVGYNPALALAIVWNYLDDAYTAAPSQEINEAFVYLGIAYAAYLEGGLMPLTDIVAKFVQDTNGNDIPQRAQSLHDNLLGNLNGAVLASRFGAGSALYNQFMALIGFLEADPTTRPYFAGNEGNDPAAVRQWDIDNGYIPSASGRVIASDADQNAVLTFSAPSAGTYGTFSIDSATGRWTYHLDSDRAATQALAEGERVRERFRVTVTDEHGASASETVVIVVIGTNDAPVVSVLSCDAAAASLQEVDSALTASGTLTASDVDANAVLSAEKLSVAANGPVGGLSDNDLLAFFSVTQNTLADGDKLTWSFDSVSEAFDYLKAGETLTLTYSVRVSDGEGAFDDIDVTVTITGTNDAPVVEAVTAQGNEDALIEVVFTGGDVDGTFEFVIKSLSAEGTLYRNADGTGELQIGDRVSGPVYFAPSANFSGQASFNYAAIDDEGEESSQAAATVNVLPIADAPLFDMPLGAASGDEDTAITLSGAVVSVADTDGSETIKLVLSGFPAGTVFSIGALDETPGSDTLGKWVIASGVGSIDLSTVTFTTPENWNGQFTLTVEAIVTDSVDIGGTIFSDTRTETRTIDVTVNPVNDVPIAVPLTLSGNEDEVLTIALAGSDVEGGVEFIITSLPANGGLYRDSAATDAIGTGDRVSGPVYFKPDADWSGDTSFDYTAIDEDNAQSTPVTVSIEVIPVNDAPNAQDITVSGDEDAILTVSLSGSDLEGPVSFIIKTLPANGALYLNADGSGSPVAIGEEVTGTVYFVPDQDWNGDTSFTYTALDSDGVESSIATASITIDSVNDAPTVSSSLQLGDITELPNNDPEEGTKVHVQSGTFSFSDVDVGDTHSASFSLTSVDVPGMTLTPAQALALRGTFEADLDQASKTITWTYSVSDAAIDFLDAGQTASIIFSVTVDDGNGGTASKSVVISVHGALDNVAPTAENVTVPGNEDALIAVTLDGTDSDGTVSGYVIKSLPLNGTLYRNADGTGVLAESDTITGDTVYFLPAGNFSGQVTFDYAAVDNAGEESAEAAATVNVAPVADVPVLDIFTQPVPRSAEVRLNTTISGEQVLSTVSALGNGYPALGTGYVAVWMNQSGQIFLQLMAPDQTKIGPEQVVATGTNLIFPSVAVLDSGGFVVVWEGSGGSGAGIYAKMYNGAGVGGTAFFVGAGANASIDALPNSGGFAVAHTNSNNLYVSRFTESGTFASAKTITLPSAVGFAEVVALNAAGSVAVIYQSGAGIAYAVLDASNNTIGSGTVVSGGANASISASTDGGFAVAWVGGGAQGNGVYVKLYDASGTAISGNLFVAATNLGEYSSIVALPDGGYVVSYSLSSDVYAQRFTSEGVRIGNPFLLSVSDAGNQVIDPHYGGAPTMTVLSNGDLVATWTYAGPGSSGFDVYSRIFRLDAPAIVTGAEDSAITLPVISTAVTDLDGSETLVIALSGYPAGTTFSVGAYDSASGKWLITDATQIANLDTTPLTVTPPANWDGIFDIMVEAIVTDSNGVQTDTYTETRIIQVTVNPVNDAPVAEAVSAQGNEDTLIAVTFDGVDVDGTVTGYVIKSLPSNGTLYSDAAGTVALAIGDTVTSQAFFKPDANFSGQVTFSYAAIDNNFEESAAATATVNTLPVADEPLIVGGQIEVVSLLTGTDNSPLDTTRLIALSNGNFAMILRGSGTGGYSDIFAKIVDGDGNTVVSRFALTSTNGVNETQPQIAALPNGGFVATWQTLASPVPTDVFVRIYDPVTGLSSRIVVNDAGTTSNRNPVITTFSDGGFVVVWHSEADNDIHARVYDAAGNPLTGQLTVNEPNSTADYIPQVGTLSDGGFVVTWQAARGDNDVFARIYDADGTPRSGEFSVNAPNSDADYEWQMTALPGGGFVVTWLSTRGADGTNVYARVFDAAGNALSVNDITVSVPNNVAEDDVQVTALSSGGFVITYKSFRDDGTLDNNIYGRVFAADGSPVSNEITISPANNADDTISKVVGLDDGGFAVVWKSQGSSYPQVFARQFDAAGVAVGDAVLLGTISTGSSNPNVLFGSLQIAIDPVTGRLIVVGDVGIPVNKIVLGVIDTRSIDVSGNEDALITLPAVTVNPSDTDGSETLTISFSGFPAGTVFSNGALDTASGKWVIVTGVQSFDLSTIEMTPAADYAGNFKLTFEVTVTDTVTIGGVPYTSTLTESREIDVTVNQVNDIPAAESFSVTGDENTVLTVNLAGSDIEGPVTFIVKSLPANGALYLNADGSGSPITIGQEVSGPVYFKPNALWNGSTGFTYVALDSDGAESPAATVSITVNDVNDVPTATNVTAAGNEDALIAVTFDGADTDGTVDGYVIKGLPTNGTLYRNADGTGALVAGDTITGDTVYFLPAANFSGQVTFGYTVVDNAGEESAEATATVNVLPVADVPVLMASATASGDEDTQVQLSVITAAVTDTDGSESLVIALSGYPAGAAFSVGAFDSASGKWLITGATEIANLATTSLAMTPPSNWNGTFTLTVEAIVTDTNGAQTDTYTETRTIAVTVNPVNDAPVVQDHTFSVSEDGALSNTVATGATDADNDPASLTYALVGGSVDGLAFNANGTFTYAPPPGYQSLDDGETDTVTFQYVANDGTANSDPKTVTITVVGANDAPFATGTTHYVTEDQLGAFTGSAATGSYDADGDTLTFQLVSNPAGAAFGSDGSYSFTLNPADYQYLNESETVTIPILTFRAFDGDAYSGTQTIEVIVIGVNDAPTFTSSSTFSVAENTTAVGNVTSTDPDSGATVSYSISGGADASRFSINLAGELSFVNAPDYENPIDVGANNVYEVQVTATDNYGATTAQDIVVTVTNVNEITFGAANASPIYAFADNSYAQSVNQPETISINLASQFVGAPAGTSYSYTPIKGNWSSLSRTGDVLNWAGDPTSANAGLYVAMVSATSPGGETQNTLVAFTILPDGSNYQVITGSGQVTWAVGSVIDLDDTSNITNAVNGPDLDVILGNNFNNTLNGQHSDDAIYGGGGNDTLNGGSQSDFLSGGDGDDTLIAGTDGDFLLGDAGNDTLTGSGVDDWLFGGAGNDTITDPSGTNRIYGGAGDDTITGGTGIDYIYGEEGNDILRGGGGNDILNGGAGNDTLYGSYDGGVVQYTGGGGDDRFVIAALKSEQIVDFGNGNDVIDLTALFDVAPGKTISNYVDLDGSSLRIAPNGDNNFWGTAVVFQGTAPTSVSILYDDTAGAIHRQTIT